jgi:hypothetical protein
MAISGGPLMQLAYSVHGAFTLVAPCEIPREYKVNIRDMIDDIASAFSDKVANKDK